MQRELKKLLQLAYSAERAASFAYQGHAASVSNIEDKLIIKSIEDDEWYHRKEVLEIMRQYNIDVNKFYEIKYYVIGKIISYSCYILGWFIPMYFAGRLESGNVNEYFRMIELFHELNIFEHDNLLKNLGEKEKEHEVYFLEKIREHRLLPFFERIFGWGAKKSYNNIEL